MRAASTFVALALLAAHPAEAAEPPPAGSLTFRADRLDGDLAAGRVTLEGRVELAYDRYRLRGERLELRTDRGSLVFSGDARVALCPCPEVPLSFVVSGGRFEPPGDVILRFPRLAIAGVPVLGLPWLWLRAPDRVGILPPLMAVRGADGLLLGSGVHLPWRRGDLLEGVDLLAGGYVGGGAEIGAHLVVAGTEARVTADLVHGTRVALEARGDLPAVGPRAAGIAWSVDAVRGDRALSGTVDLQAAARPFDTSAVEVAWRAGAGPVSVLVAGGALARAGRGAGPIAAGPRTVLALGGPLGGVGTWSADALGVVLAEGASGAAGRALPLGRASAGAEMDARPGPFELRAGLRTRGRFAGDGGASGPSREAAGEARMDLDLPFERAFEAPADRERAPLRHWIIPTISLRGGLASQTGPFFLPLGGVVPSASWIAAGGISTAVGRQAGSALRLDARAGVAGEAGAARGLVHARLGADAPIAAAAVEAAGVGEPVEAHPNGRAPLGARSGAILGKLRLGTATSVAARLEIAVQGGREAGRARSIAAGAWAALPGDDLAYLSVPGWTGGAELSVPWTRALRTSARTDADLGARALLAVRGLVEYRHPCGCLGLGLLAAHRVGRDGVDVAFSVDLAPPAAGRALPSTRP